MANEFDRILDECIDRVNRGERLEGCLASYPEHAKKLGPLLQAMLDTQTAYTFTPSPTAKMAARQRFNATLEELAQTREEKRPLFSWIFGQSKAWVAVAVVLLIAVIGYFGLRPMISPIGPSPQPSPKGNFAFLISDDVNAIGDFQNLNISISKIGLHVEGEDGQWIEFDPEVEGVDLTRLQGDKAQEIWRGDVPEGQYTKVFIYVSNVSGILEATGRSISVKLPSDKLQISKSFSVTSGYIANFVNDVTVVEAGKSGQYIIKPQVGESGADRSFEKVDG